MSSSTSTATRPAGGCDRGRFRCSHPRRRPGDSRLMARTLGSFAETIVGSPDYFRRMGIRTAGRSRPHPPDVPPAVGRVCRWPFSRRDGRRARPRSAGRRGRQHAGAATLFRRTGTWPLSACGLRHSPATERRIAPVAVLSASIRNWPSSCGCSGLRAGTCRPTPVISWISWPRICFHPQPEARHALLRTISQISLMTGGRTSAARPLQHSISNRLHGLAEFLVWVKLRFEDPALHHRPTTIPARTGDGMTIKPAPTTGDTAIDPIHSRRRFLLHGAVARRSRRGAPSAAPRSLRTRRPITSRRTFPNG